MCGIVGIWSSNTGEATELRIRNMADSLTYRGPDDTGVWVDAQGGIALGHRRLSIVDLSAAGHQPMHSNSGRYVIVLNGEIYNHLALRQELAVVDGFGDQLTWRGHSDTETLLAAFEAWGLEGTLNKTIGMFALALWDKKARMLHLARDRFGEKPLYYGWVGNGAREVFVFASELKAFRIYPDFSNPVSREALALYMRFTYVPAPYSIFQNCFKLEPGCLLSISGDLPIPPNHPLRPLAVYGGFTLTRWWSLGDVVVKGSKNQIIDEAEALQLLELRLKDAVRLQSLADVPLGAFLSGGIDSSTIVALMQQQSMRPVKTFTVGFEEASFDESSYARAVALQLGTDHSELFVTAAQAQAVIPKLPTIYDEPFADASQIPTYLVCKMARQQVTVALSGDAGDELFGGYQHYMRGARIWANMSWLPYRSRKMLGKIVGAVPVSAWDGISVMINTVLPSQRALVRFGNKVHWVAERLRGDSNVGGLHKSIVSKWKNPTFVVKGASGSMIEPPSLLDNQFPLSGLEQSELEMMYRDSITYLADDILCKVDRAAMATSLETRIPFLDHRVVELAWQLPLNMKIRGVDGKWALRQVLYKSVQKELIDRPKAGFSIPVGEWLRGPLRDWAEELLNLRRLQTEGYFYPEPIRNKWAEHLSGLHDHSDTLWTVLMFQAWLENENEARKPKSINVV